MVIFVYFAVIALAFFLLIVLPQRRRTNAHRALLAALQVGDEVITIGGILGTIRELDDEKIRLEVADGVVLTVARNAIAQIGDRRPGPVHQRRGRERAGRRVTVRRNVWFLVITLVLVFGAFLITVQGGHEPVLGLDLQGGTSVVLSPVGKFKPDTLDVAIDIIRNRVDTFGTLEPEITRQGSDIVIDLPGVKDRDKAIALVGKTAELRFRPVLAPLPSEAAAGQGRHHHDHDRAGCDHHDHRAAADRGRGAEGDRGVRRRPRSRRSQPSPPRPAAKTQRNACVVLPDKPGSKTSQRYYLGKAGLTGKGTVEHREGRVRVR